MTYVKEEIVFKLFFFSSRNVHTLFLVFAEKGFGFVTAEIFTEVPLSLRNDFNIKERLSP